MKLKPYKERLKEIQNEFGKNTTRTDKEIIEVFENYLPQFNDCIGKLLTQGQVISHNGIKYKVMQSVTPIESQPPNATGMLAIYKPYRDDEEYEWLYGEYVEIGWIRYTITGTEEEPIINRYKAIQDPNANIYSPELIPAIWVLIEG